MSTFMARSEDIQRKWYVIDASGKTLGSVAVKAADILRGKGNPKFTPHVDCGDHVVIINAAKIVLTGNKLDKKYYRHHTGYIGGLKEVKYRIIMDTKPEFAVTTAIQGMIPDTTIGRKALTRLRVYRGAEHEQAAQQPQTLTF